MGAGVILKWIFLMMCCIYVSSESIDHPEEILTSSLNGRVSHKMPTEPSNELLNCYLRTPQGAIYSIFPSRESNLTDPNIVIDTFSIFHQCGFEIHRMNMSYTGKWTLFSSSVDVNKKEVNENQLLNFLVEEQVAMLPSTSIWVYEGESIHISFPTIPPQIVLCEYDAPGTSSSFSNERLHMSIGSKCDVTFINVQSDLNGSWKFKARGENIIYYGKVNISVKEILPLNDTEYNLVLGSSSLLKFGPESAKYCQAINPTGEVQVRMNGQCSFLLEYVTKAHQGVWKVEVGLPGMTRLQTYKYTVSVDSNDPNEISYDKVQTQVFLSDNKKVMRAVCSLMADSMNSCLMVRSDGETFILSPGFGNEKYFYYGKGTYEDSKGNTIVDCGIEVQNASLVDLQDWQCIINHGKDKQDIGGFVNIIKSNDPIFEDTNGNSTNMVEKNSDIIMQTVGKSFVMTCSSSNEIKYCWFQSPNKTQFIPMPGDNNTNYEYVGRGLTFGECGIKIQSAALDHSGTWTCNMGASYIGDIKRQIGVKIYGSKLVAYYNYGTPKGITIGCKTFDNSSLEYCRFVRPDGYGIKPVGGHHKYYGNGTNLESGICQITLEDTSYIDIGKWTCAGKPYIIPEEYSDTITLIKTRYYSNGSLGWNSFSWIFYFIFIIGLTFIMISLIQRTKAVTYIQHRARSVRNSFRSKEQDTSGA